MDQLLPDPGPESHGGDLLETLDFDEEAAGEGSEEEMTEEGDEFNTPAPPLTLGTVLELLPKRKIGNVLLVLAYQIFCFLLFQLPLQTSTISWPFPLGRSLSSPVRSFLASGPK